MAMNALNAHLVTAIDNTAAGVSNLYNMGKGWLQYSDVVWISSALTYYALEAAKYNSWDAGLESTDAAKFVALAISIYGLAQGFMTKGERTYKEDKKVQHEELIAVTNTVVVSLYAANRFLGLKLNAVQALFTTAIAYGLVRMAHTSYFPAK